MIPEVRKRNYKSVTVEADGGGFVIMLDGRPVHTPRRQPMRVPAEGLGETIADEWRAQGAKVDPSTMPLTRLAGSAIDIVAPSRAEVAARTAAYASTDMLCYRAAAPADLVERQRAGWQPLIEWATDRFGAELRVTSGIVVIEQTANALQALANAVQRCDDMRLTALAAATAACGSLVLALALMEGRVDADEAWALSLLDESYQIEKWGEDPEASKRRENLRADIRAAARFLALLAS